MKINLISFGEIAEMIGNKSLQLTVKNIDDLIETLHLRFPALQQKEYAIAVNNQIATKNTILNDGDTVALMPPFSGG